MKEHLDRAWLQREWIEKHRLLKDIAAECGVSRQAVHQQASKFGLKYLSPGERIDVSWLREQVEVNRRIYADIGLDVGLSKSRIGILCRHHGIKKSCSTKAERAARNLAHQNERYRTDPEFRAKKKAIATRWQKEHPEKQAAACRRWQERHPGVAREYQRRYRERRKEAQVG